MNNEELKEFINSKREPITSCKDLTKHFIGIHKTIPVYLTPSFEKEFNYKMTKLGELQQENQELKKQLEKTNKTEIYIDAENMEERYCEGLYQDYLEKENKQLRDVLNKAKYKIERKIAFCSSEAEGYINSEKCNKTILFLKKLLDDLEEVK